MRHPYRTHEGETKDARLASFEERALGLVLVFAGLLGILISVEAPSQHALEMVLGALFVVLGGWTLGS